jgi:hypothetical protein
MGIPIDSRYNPIPKPRKQKRDYGAERREAARWADKAMQHYGVEDPILSRRQWLEAWGIAYEAYIAGIRRKMK